MKQLSDYHYNFLKMEQFINAERKAGEETGANATIYRILGDQFLEVYDDLKSMTDVGGL